MVKTYLCLFTAFFSLQAFASITGSLATNKKSLYSIRKNLEKIENKIKKTNTTYIGMVKRRQRLDLEIYDLGNLIREAMLESEKVEQTISTNYKRLLINSLDFESEGDLLERKAIIMKLKKQRKLAAAQKTELETMQRTLRGLREEFQVTVKRENTLFAAVKNLESEKQVYANKYLDKKVAFEKLKAKMKKVAKRSNNALKTFIHPVVNYATLDYGKKGISYTLKENGELKASKAGKIVHIGTLANYGKVMMIDHGKDVISIYLGDFNAKMKKGNTVKQGQIVGYTQRPLRKGVLGKVYFEIRKKDKVWNTIKYVKADKTRV